MSDFRIRYGSAFGPYGTAAVTSAQNLIPYNDTTPDVTEGTFFVTANTSATTITYFDVREPQGNTSTRHNGKVVLLYFQDNNTTIANAGQIFLSGTGGAMTSGQTLALVYYNSAWVEFGGTARQPLREQVKTVTVGGTFAPNVAGVDVLIVLNTAASTLIGLSGGTLGQRLTVVKDLAASGTALTLTGAANF